MGSFDGAEICDLVGLYLLSILSREFSHPIGLYRDDGLAVLKTTPKIVEDAKKKLCHVFKEHGLNITVDANKKVVNFLDVTLNLTNSTHGPFLKPGNTPVYVHSQSNHPPSVIKNIPESVNRRLSAISSNEQIFTNAVAPYQEAITRSGYKHKLNFRPPIQNAQRRRNRPRKILWYNPPFNTAVKTNIGQKFFKIVEESFPPNHKLSKIFNRNSLKLSYSCMQNMGNLIKSHNKSRLKTNNNQDSAEERCNCNVPATCPLPGRCTASNIVYQATVICSNNSTEKYIGCTANEFKVRFNNHKSSFTHRGKEKETELSKHIWSISDAGNRYNMQWKIVSKGAPYSNISKRCDLCLEERFWIKYQPEEATLNKRDEIIATCRHKKKFLISQA